MADQGAPGRRRASLHRCITALLHHRCTTASMPTPCCMHAPFETPAKPAKGPLLALRRGEGRRASGTQNPHIDPTEPGAAPSSAQSVLLCWEPGLRSSSLSLAHSHQHLQHFQLAPSSLPSPAPAPAQESKQASKQASRQERKKGQKLGRARAGPGAGATRPGPLAPQINLPLSQQPA